MDLDKFLTTSEVAQQLRVTRKSVTRWIADGKLRAIRAGRDYRIRESDLNQFIRQSTQESKAKKVEGLALAA